MKRYLVFAGDVYYPAGGMHDMMAQADCFGEACAQLVWCCTEGTCAGSFILAGLVERANLPAFGVEYAPRGSSFLALAARMKAFMATRSLGDVTAPHPESWALGKSSDLFPHMWGYIWDTQEESEFHIDDLRRAIAI